MSKKQTPLKPIDPQIQALADEHHSSKEAVLEIFQELQDQRGGLGEGTLNDVARALRIPAHSAYGIATFYSMLSLHNRKNGVIRIGRDKKPSGLDGRTIQLPGVM
jgi:NADH:ubiquinone oxidoreductase subunit E